MYLSVIEVEPNKDKKLLLTFENGEKRIFDMKEYLEYGVFQELKDENIFNSVHIAFDSIEWSNGLDIDPEVLYEKSSPINL
jgi:hypothetical protein